MHLGILRQLGFELLQELLGILLRHLGDHLRVGKLIIELLLDAEFLLRLAQRCPGLGEVLALFRGVVMFRDLL